MHWPSTALPATPAISTSSCVLTRKQARVLRALADFGFGSLDLKVEDFSHPDRVLQLGYAPVRVDLITSLTGVSWEQVEAGLVSGNYGDAPVRFIGRAELVANKRATGRRKDNADLKALGEE